MIKAYFLIMGIFILILNQSSAQTIIGVSPADVNLKDVLRGGYSERYVSISLSSEEKVNMQIEPRGEIKDWLNFSTTEYMVSNDNPWRLLISVSPPNDIPNGNYTGILRISSDSLDKSSNEGHAVGKIMAVVDLVINLEIVDRESLACRANSFEVKSAEKGDGIIFSLNVFNDGNIRLKPKTVGNIWDAEQTGIVKSFDYTGVEILPTKSGRVEFTISSSDLEVGQYWVDLSVPDCYQSDTLTFDILEEGALRADGIITNILTRNWANIDETVPIIVLFRNVGQKEVDSQFRGKISLGDEIIQVLESPKTSVGVNEDNNFTFYFTPRKSGKFIISGRVFYDKKRTFESSSIVNVKPRNITLKNIIIYVAYLLIIVIIIILIYKIRSERTRYIWKLRGLKNYV